MNDERIAKDSQEAGADYGFPQSTGDVTPVRREPTTGEAALEFHISDEEGDENSLDFPDDLRAGVGTGIFDGLQDMAFDTITLYEGGRLEPKDDITPMEAVRIAQLLVLAGMALGFDCKAFVEKHGLERHFE